MLGANSGRNSSTALAPAAISGSGMVWWHARLRRCNTALSVEWTSCHKATNGRAVSSAELATIPIPLAPVPAACRLP